MEAILNYEKPKTVEELRKFLGMINFYRRFLPNAADKQACLHAYHKSNKRRDKTAIVWNDCTIKAFDECKQSSSLAQATLLLHPDSLSKISIMVDASDVAVVAVLQQSSGSDWKPLGFFSKKLSPAEVKYSAYDRELLAAYLAVKHFKHYIEGREFTLYTDQKPLTFAFNQKSEKATPRQVRHLDFISQFTTDIRHVSGRENVVADALSRIEVIKLGPDVDYDIIAKEQLFDDE